MNETLSLQEIIIELQNASDALTEFCSEVNDNLFFYQPAEKWSIAQNIRHLTIAAKKTQLAFRLPGFILTLWVGKPNRPSRTYEELLKKYKLKLEQGGRVSGAFVPEKIPSSIGKKRMLENFSSEMNQLSGLIQRRWKDEQLDQFIVPHPLLGKITLRELCYFTILHTYHHLDGMKKRLAELETVNQNEIENLI